MSEDKILINFDFKLDSLIDECVDALIDEGIFELENGIGRNIDDDINIRLRENKPEDLK